jgi:hypothetical protein
LKSSRSRPLAYPFNASPEDVRRPRASADLIPGCQIVGRPPVQSGCRIRMLINQIQHDRGGLEQHQVAIDNATFGMILR